MRLILLLISFVLCLSALQGCGNHTRQPNAEPTTDSIVGHTDTTIVIEDTTPAPDTILTHRLRSEQDAIEFMEQSGRWDQYSQGILPCMAKDNLDYTERLLKNPFDYFIVVDKPSMHVILFDRYGVEKRAYKMACSRKYGTKHKKRDNRTPEGFFTAEGIYDSTEWLYTDDDGNTSKKKGQFGPRFIRLKTNVTSQIGIHGTCAPWALGARVSHGCIRIHNDNILELVKFVEVGMPIIVNPSARDQAVNIKEECEVPKINLGRVKERPVDPASIPDEDDEKEKTKTDSISTDSIPVNEIKPDSIAAEKPEQNITSVTEPDGETETNQ